MNTDTMIITLHYRNNGALNKTIFTCTHSHIKTKSYLDFHSCKSLFYARKLFMPHSHNFVGFMH